MSPLLQALGQGYTEEEILGYISKAIPQMAPAIKKATRSGYDAKQVIGFLSKNFDIEDRRGKSESQIHAINARSDAARTKHGLAMAAGTVAVPLAMNAARSAFSRALPQSLTGLAQSAFDESVDPNNPTNPGAMNPLQSSSGSTSQMPQVGNIQSSSTSQPPVNAPSMPQVAQPAQAEGISNKLNVKDLLSKHGILNRINQLKEAGVSNEEIAKFTKETSPLEMSKLEKETGESADKLVSQYLSETTPKEEKAKPIAKNSTVIAPQGVGEVKSIKDKSALIDIDGKTHKVDVEDLEQEPEDVIQTVQELLQIPEVDRSSVVSLFTYDPEDKQMIIQFHDGESYKYLDVDPEKMMTVANKMGIPVTKGKNIFGAWSPEDKKSLGATLIKEIINDPKYKKAKKGEEANPNYRQMDTLFDYWEKLRKKPKKKKNA